MKKSPHQEKLEKTMRSSAFSSCGFLGTDKRNIWEIIETDAGAVAKLGTSCHKIADRMKSLTVQAQAGLGDWVKVRENLRVRSDDARGSIPCPWSHGVRCLKTTTTAERTDTGEKIQWSDLNIHLIKAHGFFEGKGSPYRLEPARLVQMLFDQ